jgi:EAL domain-containing protein (putative c-di-GMP-specific phosphodiesterase class I)
MEQLYAQGIRLAIDDFGTGYSSLSYLKRIRAHRLKIDRSFICDLADNEDDRAIVSAIISLARSMGMRTIAEGVETPEQLSLLRALGCDEIQGYLLSRPLPQAAFLEFLKTPVPFTLPEADSGQQIP